MSEPTLYVFDGYNLLHAGGFSSRGELVDRLASFVAARGVRGIVVFDGEEEGGEREVGSLSVRFSAHADDLLERLAAEHRGRERVCLVSSDLHVRRVSGQEVRSLSSQAFLAGLEQARHRDHDLAGSGGRLRERLDPGIRELLERLRRGR
jgi:predicted RNA-binding protein with PIN domain